MTNQYSGQEAVADFGGWAGNAAALTRVQSSGVGFAPEALRAAGAAVGSPAAFAGLQVTQPSRPSATPAVKPSEGPKPGGR